MRKGRLIFWICSLIICSGIIVWNYKQENAIPYEEKTPINVYCLEEFQEDVKKMIEKSSIGENNRVVFTKNKEEAEFILTDTITNTDTGYSKIGWTPLIVAFDNTNSKTVKTYRDNGYIILKKDSDYYDINFEKIIESVLSNEFIDKIYCPNLNTKEGKLFYQFLLINANSGKYPENEEQIKKCTQIANKFLNSDVVVKCDVSEKLHKKRTVENELYIIFEKDLKGMSNNYYNFQISYPTNTVLYEFYYCCQGKNEMEILNVLKNIKFVSSIDNKDKIMYNHCIRSEGYGLAFNSNYYYLQDGFSYVDIPLNSIQLEE